MATEPIAFRKVTGAARLTVVETDIHPRRLSGMKAALDQLAAYGVQDESWWITPEVTDTGWLRLRAEFEEDAPVTTLNEVKAL